VFPASNRFFAVLLAVMTALPALADEKRPMPPPVSRRIPASSPALTPADALAYMKETKNLYILDVSTTDEKFNKIHFVGAVHIPLRELPVRIGEIPSDRPVLLNCRTGRTVQEAYPAIKRLRPDIKELSYIAGTPLFQEYNDFANRQRDTLK
jgi:rhodanese-related sulfurtransferase